MRSRSWLIFDVRRNMGRAFFSQAVLKAYDDAGALVCEVILPVAQFNSEGADLLISPERRLRDGIRFISVRTFDAEGHRLIDWRLRYAANGTLLRQDA